MSQKLQIILKLVSVCSLYCRYCYWFFESDGAWEEQPRMTTHGTLDGVVKSLVKHCKEHPLEELDIIFHGGEPMMVKKQLLISFCENLKSRLRRNLKLSFGMQTNGMHFSNEWINLIFKYNIGVGVSLDGPREYNDINRVDKKGNGSFDKISEGLKLYQKLALENNKKFPAVLAVINPEYDYTKVYNSFRELGFKHINFLLPDKNYESGISEEYILSIGNCLKDIFIAWAAEDDPDNIDVGVFRNPLSAFQESVRSKTMSTQVVGIGAGGELLFDDAYMATPWYKELDSKNISSTSINQYLHSSPFIEVESHKKNAPTECKSCVYLEMCGGGDVYNRYSRNNRFDNPSVYCKGLKILYKHIIKYLISNNYPKEKIIQKLNVPNLLFLEQNTVDKLRMNIQ